jgi:5-methylcytosine-specific restriction enzyme subunit McrC
MQLVPAMRTDVTITAQRPPYQRLSLMQVLCHYVSTSLHGTERFKSDNLYQVYAYLRTQEQRRLSHRGACGMLLYPTTTYTLNEAMVVQGHRIQVATVNLSESWEKIEASLVSLVSAALLDFEGQQMTS